MNASLRERRLHVAALALFAALGPGDAGPRAEAPDAHANTTDFVHEVALPPVSAPPPGFDPASVEADVFAQLQRYARRSGLAEHERRELARIIVREARRHDLDPILVLAVIHVESRYDAYAVSHKDAMGLMQILPSTGAWLAPQVGVTWYGPQTLFDPESNVRLGVAYLRQLADRYDGDVATALAAYNWGPGAIDRFLARGRPLPREYAQLVLAAYTPGS